MKKYKILFRGIHIGKLAVEKDLYSYTANSDTIEDVCKDFPIFDILKKDISAKNIPFFKIRLEKDCQKFETDDYEIVPD